MTLFAVIRLEGSSDISVVLELLSEQCIFIFLIFFLELRLTIPRWQYKLIGRCSRVCKKDELLEKKFCGTEASVQLFFLLEKGLFFFVNTHLLWGCSSGVRCCSGSAPLQGAVLLIHSVPGQGECHRCQLRKRLSTGKEIQAPCHRLRKLRELREGGCCCQEENLGAAELSWKPLLKLTCFFILFNRAQGSTTKDTYSEPPRTWAYQWPTGWNIYTDFGQEHGVSSSWKKVLAVLFAICTNQLILAH